LDESHREDIPQDTVEENRILVEEFTKEEVRNALFQIEHNKALGPDGFLIEFYQTFSHLIKSDMMALFHEFHQGTLPLYSLNFGTIILLPKCTKAIKIQQYRPIYLMNVSFKIFIKVITNRLIEVAHRVIQQTQLTFLPGRNIMEGVVVLHETIIFMRCVSSTSHSCWHATPVLYYHQDNKAYTMRPTGLLFMCFIIMEGVVVLHKTIIFMRCVSSTSHSCWPPAPVREKT
jgi:hypothetical protein